MKLSKHIRVIKLTVLVLAFGVFSVHSNAQSEADSVGMFIVESDFPFDSVSFFKMLDSIDGKTDYRSKSLYPFEINYKTGMFHLKNNRYKEAFEYFDNAKMDAHSSYYKGILFRSIGITYYKFGDYDLALENLYQSIQILGNDTESEDLAKSLDGLASVNRELGKTEEARNIFQDALEIRLNIDDSLSIADSYLNLGNINVELGLYDIAEKYYKKSLKIYTGFKKELRLAVVAMNIGTIAYEQDRLKDAVSNYENSLNFFLANDKLYNAAILYQNLGNTFFELGNIDQALKNYENAIVYAKKVRSNALLKTIYKNIALTYKELGKYKKSIEYYTIYDELSEEIFDEELDNTLAEWQVKLETAEKEKEIAILKKNEELNTANIKQRTTERNGLLIFAALLLALAFSLFFAFRSKQKANKKLSVQKAEIQKNHAEKALLLKELHHRVKNNLQIVSSLLSLQSFQVNDEQTREAIVQGRNRVEAMSLIHQKLYQTDQITHIDLKEYVENLTLNTMYSFGFTERDIQFAINSKSLLVNVDIAIPLGLIINELVTNSFKHAFKEIENPKLEISLSRKEKDQLSIKIIDNGAGLPNGFEFDKEGSFGMELIQSLCRQIRAELILHDGPGCNIELITST